MKSYKLFIVVIASIWLSLKVLAMLATSKKGIIDTTKYSSEIPGDYLNVLHLRKNCCQDTSNKFYFFGSLKTAERYPISYFIYDKSFFVQLYKLKSHFDNSLTKIISEKDTDASVEFYNSFVEDDASIFNYKYKIEFTADPEVLYLKLNGKNNRLMMKSDTIVDYYSLNKNFSIQYSGDDAYDLYGESRAKRNYFTVKTSLSKLPS